MKTITHEVRVSKEITIKGKEFHYEIFYDTTEYSESYLTIFYDGFKTVQYRKYFLFGPKLEKQVGNEVFRVYFSIEDSSLTKCELRDILERKVLLLEREGEVERGDLI